VFSCNKDKVNFKTSAVDKKLTLYEYNIKYLKDWEKEKITLLSIISGVDKEKVITVIADYETKISYSSNYDDLEKIIDTISLTRLIQKRKVAKIIFGYKYEMITKYDVMEDLEKEYNADKVEDGFTGNSRGY
jgi:asparagine N-glycosylation enzyme membrane subunit Stt3